MTSKIAARIELHHLAQNTSLQQFQAKNKQGLGTTNIT